MLLAKINFYIDGFDLVFYYLPLPHLSACNRAYESVTVAKPECQEPSKQFLHTLKYLEYTKPEVEKYLNFILLCS